MGRKGQQLAPPGQMVDVGGVRLHALVQGEGGPVVVLEPALGGFALQYTRIQAGVAGFARVLAYDRAGQGWSDPSPKPRTPDHLAGELHALLDRLGLRPPYVLVGHSFGGLAARTFAGLHPGEIAGLGAEFRRLSEARTQTMRELMWDEADGFFYDCNARAGQYPLSRHAGQDPSGRIRVKSMASFAALWAGVATAE